MDPTDSEIIIRSLPALQKNLDLNPHFLRLLCSTPYKIFSEQMIADIMRSDTPALNLCLKLTKRGPDAYNNFLNALREAKQDNVIIPILNQTRSTLDQPPHMLIPTRDSTVTVNSCCNNSLNNGNNGGISISDFKFPNNSPIESSLSPTSAEYRRKVLDPPNYMEATPSSPGPRGSVTDAIPPDYNILEVKVINSTTVKGLDQDAYPNIYKKPRGQALIMNFEEFANQIVGRRIGSEKDVIHLDQLLQQLGYNVTIKSNLNRKEALEELEMFTKCEEHATADSTVVAVMSHGKGGNHEEGTLIYTRDCNFLSSEDILRRFNNINCPLLKGKPKLFLFQFCRGDNIDVGLRNLPPLQSTGRTVTDGNPVPVQLAHDYERSVDDMLIAYSTLPGYVSYREESEGTWFLKALCLVFMKHANECHVDRLLQIVDEQIRCWTGQKNGKQTLEITRRGFNKKFYFNPGMWK